MMLPQQKNVEHASSSGGANSTARRSGELQPELVSISGGSRLFRKHKNNYMRNKQRRRAAAIRASNSTTQGDKHDMKKEDLTPSASRAEETSLQQPTLEEDRPSILNRDRGVAAGKATQKGRESQKERTQATTTDPALSEHMATARQRELRRELQPEIEEKKPKSSVSKNIQSGRQPEQTIPESGALVPLYKANDPRNQSTRGAEVAPATHSNPMLHNSEKGTVSSSPTVPKPESVKETVTALIVEERVKATTSGSLEEPIRDPDPRSLKPPLNERATLREHTVDMANASQTSPTNANNVAVNDSTPGTTGGSDAKDVKETSSESRWRRHGEMRRRLLLKRDREMGGTTFVLNRKCPIERYYEVANRVLDQFRAAIRTTTGSSPTEDKIETIVPTPPHGSAPTTIEETFLMGHRLVKFLEDVLPTHADYFSHRANLSRLRLKSRSMLERARHDLTVVELKIDRLEANKFILSDLKTQKKKRKKQREVVKHGGDDALDDSRSTISATSSQGSLPSSAAAALNTSAGSIEILVSLAELEASSKSDKKTQSTNAHSSGSVENQKSPAADNPAQSKQSLSGRDAAVDRWRSKGRSRNQSYEQFLSPTSKAPSLTADRNYDADLSTRSNPANTSPVWNEPASKLADDTEKRVIQTLVSTKAAPESTGEPMEIGEEEPSQLDGRTGSSDLWGETDFPSPSRSEARKHATSTPTKEQETLSLQPSPTSVLEVLYREEKSDETSSFFPPLSSDPQWQVNDGRSGSCWDKNFFGIFENSTATFSDVFVTTEDGFPAVDATGRGGLVHPKTPEGTGSGKNQYDPFELFPESEQTVQESALGSWEGIFSKKEEPEQSEEMVETFGTSVQKLAEAGSGVEKNASCSPGSNPTVTVASEKTIAKDANDGSNDSEETTSTESSTSQSGDGSDSEDDDDDNNKIVKQGDKGSFGPTLSNPPPRRRNGEGLTFLQRVARENFTRGVLDMLAEEDSDADDSWAPSSEHNYLVGDYVGDGNDQDTITDDVVEPNLDSSSVTGFSTEASEKLVGVEIVSEGSDGNSDVEDDDSDVEDDDIVDVDDWSPVRKLHKAPAEMREVFSAVIDGDIDEQSAGIVHDPDLDANASDDASAVPELEANTIIDVDDASADAQNASIYTDPTIDLMTNSDSQSEDESTGGSSLDEDEHANFEKMIRMEFGELVGEEAVALNVLTKELGADHSTSPAPEMLLYDDSEWTTLTSDFRRGGTDLFSTMGEEGNITFPSSLDVIGPGDSTKTEGHENWAKFPGFSDPFGMDRFAASPTNDAKQVGNASEGSPSRSRGDIIQRKMVSVPDKLDHLELRVRALREGRTSGGPRNGGLDFFEFGSSSGRDDQLGGKIRGTTRFLYEPEDGEDEV